MILHSASLSVAGFLPPSQATVDALHQEADRTRTPWIGEHLAFVSADGINEEAERDLTPTNLTYTLCPQLSEETLERVVENMASFRQTFSAPLILENSPQYFAVPGSTMSMVEIGRRGGVEVRCRATAGSQPLRHHLSQYRGGRAEGDRAPATGARRGDSRLRLQRAGRGIWDDHAAPAPPLVFELLERVASGPGPGHSPSNTTG